MYSFIEREIKGVYEINPFHAVDYRGEVFKEYSKEIFHDINFIPYEIMTIYSEHNVLRGLHFQRKKPQDKLIRCIKGFLWAVVVDLRSEYDTFGKWINVEIGNGTEVYVPKGCAFGTLALEDSYMICMFGEKYCSDYDSGIVWNDEELDIKWPLDKLTGDVVLSKKDISFGTFKDYKFQL